MSAISYGRGRAAGDRVLRTAARGAILIGVAVVIGIVLLQVVDKAGNIGGPSQASSSTHNGTTTTTLGGRPVQEISVLVLNASGVSGAASTKANDLRVLGYAILTPGNAAITQGTTVACKSGFDKEADTLAKAVDPNGGAQVTTFPNPVPAGAENATCIVTLGKATTG